MTYLYGDSTPFPHDYNFIDFVSELVDLCAAFLRTDAAVKSEAVQKETAEKGLSWEISQLQSLSGALQFALRPFLDGSAVELREVAERVRVASESAVEVGRKQLTSRQEALLATHAKQAATQREALLRALERFFKQHVLEGTDWDLYWKANQPAVSAQARARTPLGLDVTMELATAGTQWSSPIRGSDFDGTAAIELPQPVTWLRRTPRKQERLDQLFVREAEFSAARSAVFLAKHANRPSPGFEIALSNEQARVTVHGRDANGIWEGDPVELSTADGITAIQFMGKVETKLKELCSKRVRLVDAFYEGHLVTAMEHPSDLVLRLLGGSMEKLIREVKRRSSARGELVLKRDIANGRREEIYMTREALLEKLRDLSLAQRQLFHVFELSDEEVSGLHAAYVPANGAAAAAPAAEEKPRGVGQTQQMGSGPGLKTSPEAAPKADKPSDDTSGIPFMPILKPST